MRVDDCSFCGIVAGRLPAYRIAADDTAIAFLDRSPRAPGHTLIVPRIHVRDLFDRDQAPLHAVAALVTATARLLCDRLHCDGLNLLQTNGAAAGQEVFHVHVHLIPRRTGDGALRGMFGTRVEGPDLATMHHVLTT